MVCAMHDQLDHSAPVVLCYAVGQRPNFDSPGCGPGMFYGAAVTKALFDHGIQCFSDLNMPAGSRHRFLQELGSGASGCRVMIVLQTRALYECKHCLREIYAAQLQRIPIFPLRFESNLPTKEQEWPHIEREDLEGLVMLQAVQLKFGMLNSIPSPPYTIPDEPYVLNHVVQDLKLDLRDDLEATPNSVPPNSIGFRCDQDRDSSVQASGNAQRTTLVRCTTRVSAVPPSHASAPRPSKFGRSSPENEGLHFASRSSTRTNNTIEAELSFHSATGPVPLPQGKTFHFLLSHRKEHTIRGNASSHVALILHDLLENMGWLGFLCMDDTMEKHWMVPCNMDELTRTVQAACTLIVVFSDETCSSQYCPLEWDIAIQSGIPVCCIVDVGLFNKEVVVDQVKSTNGYLLQYLWIDYTHMTRKFVASDCAKWLAKMMKLHYTAKISAQRAKSNALVQSHPSGTVVGRSVDVDAISVARVVANRSGRRPRTAPKPTAKPIRPDALLSSVTTKSVTLRYVPPVDVTAEIQAQHQAAQSIKSGPSASTNRAGAKKTARKRKNRGARNIPSGTVGENLRHEVHSSARELQPSGPQVGEGSDSASVPSGCQVWQPQHESMTNPIPMGKSPTSVVNSASYPVSLNSGKTRTLRGKRKPAPNTNTQKRA